MPTLDEQVRVALRELLRERDFTLPLESLPLRDLSVWKDLQAGERATEELQRRTTGVDELTPVPHARARREAALTITLATATAVTFDTEVFDQGDMWLSTAATRLTIPRDGLYLVTGNLAWGINNSGDRRIAWIAYNGDNTARRIALEELGTSGAGDRPAMNLSTVWRFVRGDYIELYAFADATTALDLTDDHVGASLAACFVSNYTSEALQYAPTTGGEPG